MKLSFLVRATDGFLRCNDIIRFSLPITKILKAHKQRIEEKWPVIFKKIFRDLIVPSLPEVFGKFRQIGIDYGYDLSISSDFKRQSNPLKRRKL